MGRRGRLGAVEFSPSLRADPVNKGEKDMKRPVTLSSVPLVILAGLLMAGGLVVEARAAKQESKAELPGGKGPVPVSQWLENKVRHELVMLPYYGVFDNLNYTVDGGRVELFGEVSRPTLKSDAERVVARIEGVDTVINHIEVLPVSPNDDRIRVAVYRAIFGNSALQRYSLGAVPPIHIIVKHGSVALEGIVASEMDRNIANIRAIGVSGVFLVANNLAVER
jgi:hyperosmotically inducible protein